HHRQDVRRHVENIGGNKEGPRPCNTVRLAQMKCRTAPPAAHVVTVHGQTRQLAAAVAEAQSQPACRERRIVHSSSLTRFQSSCILNDAMAAVSVRMRPPNDQRAIPGTTCARCWSLTSATSTPRMNTCVMLHGLTDCNTRRICANPC